MRKKILTCFAALVMSLMLCMTMFTENIRASNGITIDLGSAVGVLPINSGGTDATTVGEFKYLFGIGEVAEEDVLPIIKGGTGATTAAQARDNLGLFDADETLDRTFPVGAIYISMDSADPAELFGGTWEQIEDRFLLGAGSTYSAGSTGGSRDATLVSHTHTVSATAASAGSHYHSSRIVNDNKSGSYTGGSNNGYGYHYGTSDETSYRSAGTHTHSVSGTAASTGVSGTNKNMPPYIVVNVWKRTA